MQPIQFDVKEVMMLLGEKDLLIFQMQKEVERLTKRAEQRENDIDGIRKELFKLQKEHEKRNSIQEFPKEIING